MVFLNIYIYIYLLLITLIKQFGFIEATCLFSTYFATLSSCPISVFIFITFRPPWFIVYKIIVFLYILHSFSCLSVPLPFGFNCSCMLSAVGTKKVKTSSVLLSYLCKRLPNNLEYWHCPVHLSLWVFLQFSCVHCWPMACNVWMWHTRDHYPSSPLPRFKVLICRAMEVMCPQRHMFKFQVSTTLEMWCAKLLSWAKADTTQGMLFANTQRCPWPLFDSSQVSSSLENRRPKSVGKQCQILWHQVAKDKMAPSATSSVQSSAFKVSDGRANHLMLMFPR